MPRNTLFYRQIKDLQTFDSALGGIRASSIMNSGIPDRPFAVEGNSFPDFATAAQRSCDEQFQSCQQMANQGGNDNAGKGKGKGKERGKRRDEGARFTVAMCEQQKGTSYGQEREKGRWSFVGAKANTRRREVSGCAADS